MLSDQVKLISEKLAYLTPNEQRSVLVNNHKKASKQVWVKKEDNLCLVSHTALKILDTCLWYLDSGCSKHMTGDKTSLKEVQMGKGGRITYGDGSQSKVIGKGIIDTLGLGTSQEALYVEGHKVNLLSISQFWIWWCNSPRRNVIYLTAVANGLWGEKELLTIAMVFLVLLQILRFSATRQP
jgi:hypothetical protein